MKSDIQKLIFTEDIDYSKTTDKSIWGAGDVKTVQVLKKLITDKKIHGDWLNFSAGDGRYNNLLLQTVNTIIATDIDKEALEKLQKLTPTELSSKLRTQVQNITEPFPFTNDSFDGIFNAGTLHLFPELVLRTILNESNRVLKPHGIFIFDFATDINRINVDGTNIQKSEVEYSKASAKTLLITLLKHDHFKTQFISCNVPPEKVTSGDGTYTFSCNYWLIIAEKM